MTFKKLVRSTYGLALPLVILCLLGGCASTSITPNTANKKYPKLPEIIDGKALFALSKGKATALGIQSVKVSDWLFNEDGTLKDRDRVGHFEYDNDGNVVEFTGHKDRAGYIKIEYQYKDGNLLVRNFFSKSGNEFQYLAKESYKYKDERLSESIIYGNGDTIKIKKIYIYDSAGNIREIQQQNKDEITVGKILFEYDKFGNVNKKITPRGNEIYSYDNNKVSIYRLTIGGKIHSMIEYTYDNNWNLLSYFRKSGNGEYWDRFIFKYSHSIPVEKIWSKKEFIIQDPYQLTKYSYKYFK